MNYHSGKKLKGHYFAMTMIYFISHALIYWWLSQLNCETGWTKIIILMFTGNLSSKVWGLAQKREIPNSVFKLSSFFTFSKSSLLHRPHLPIQATCSQTTDSLDKGNPARSWVCHCKDSKRGTMGDKNSLTSSLISSSSVFLGRRYSPRQTPTRAAQVSFLRCAPAS